MGVGYLVGSFDLLNVEHLDIIRQAGLQCTRLVVGVLSDEHVDEATGRPPVVPATERLALVEHVRGVSEVVMHSVDGNDPVHPDITFVVDGDVSDQLNHATVLQAVRRTASATLLAALRPMGAQAVA